MSHAIDVNVLLYASDTSSPRHLKAIRFLEQRALDPDLWCIAWATLMAFLRISTHPRVFAHPLSPGESLGSVASLLNLPRVRVLSEGNGFLESYPDVTVPTFPSAATSSPTRTWRASFDSTVSGSSTRRTGISESSTSSRSRTPSPDRARA